jgi:hypothetical protein
MKRKKQKTLCIVFVALLCASGAFFGNTEKVYSQSQPQKVRRFPEPVYGNTRISFSWEDKEIIVRMIDNAATENLLSRLPLSLKWEDYLSRQKTGVIPGGLNTGNAPVQSDCFAGDLRYFDPWDMLTFFYHDFGYSRDLTPLGTVESGVEYIELLDKGAGSAGKPTVTVKLYRK